MTLFNEVECDEAYVIAGHKGQPEVVKSKGRQGRRRRLKGKGGRGTLEKERPPVFGMIERCGQVVINMMANVKQKTIEPFIKNTIVAGTLVYTDEYGIYARLQSWGYGHKSVNHGRGEVTVQIVKTGITPPLATSDRFRGAKTEPRHPAGQLHMPQ